MEKIRYATIMPLAGGMSIAHENVLGYKPEFLLSYDISGKNDNMLHTYWPEVPFHKVDDKTNEIRYAVDQSNIDFMSAIPFCSGMSMLNSGGNKRPEMKRGADAAQNAWIFNTANLVLEKFQPKVFWGENAPGLFTEMGVDLALDMYKLAQSYGYSFSLIKTNTLKHGVPQNRMRTFYFFWKSETAPILNFYNQQGPNVEAYLSNIPKDATLQDKFFIKGKLTDDITYQYINNKIENGNWRKTIHDEKLKTVLQWVEKYNLVDDLINFAKLNRNARQLETVEFLKKKRSMGLGYWDWSPKVAIDYTNAIITKNISSTVHPTEERWLNLREIISLMGLPYDYQIDPRMGQAVTQNVPVNTAMDWTREVVNFIQGKSKMSNATFLKQDNWTQKNEVVKVKQYDLF